jgi:uncharacterized protein (TIGR03067 family)
MKRTASAWLVAGIVWFVGGCSSQSGNAPRGHPLAGTTWQAEESYWNGKGGKPEKPEKVIFFDTTNQIKLPDYMGTYSVGEQATPKTIDVTVISTIADQNGKPLLGIWERNGDEMKLAYTNPSPVPRERPKDFTPREGDSLFIHVLKRVK